MWYLAERLSVEPKMQASNSNLFVEWRAEGGTGVMSLEGGWHTGFTSAVMALTSATLDYHVHVIGEVIQKCQM